MSSTVAAFEFRERVIAHLAIFTGMRPGEILGLQRQHVSVDCQSIVIKQRIYRGDIDTPKTPMSRRTGAVPPKTADLLKEWMSLVGGRKEAWVFASENPETPMGRDNLWRRDMAPKLNPIGLGWASFQALRRTHASLGHEIGVDPKVAANAGTVLGWRWMSTPRPLLGKRAEAAEKLEKAVFAA